MIFTRIKSEQERGSFFFKSFLGNGGMNFLKTVELQISIDRILFKTAKKLQKSKIFIFVIV